MAKTVGVTMVGTLSQKNLFPPGLIKQVKAAEGDPTEHTIGIIIGKVRGLSLRSNVFAEEPSKAFMGVFEARPTHGGIIRSTYCFLPKSINDTLCAAVIGDHQLPIDRAPKRGEKIEVDGLNEIGFAVEIAVRHDDSEVGYTYVCTMHGEDAFAVSDPLADLRSIVPGFDLLASPALPTSVRALIGSPTITAPAAAKPTGKPGKAVAAPKGKRGRKAA